LSEPERVPKFLPSTRKAIGKEEDENGLTEKPETDVEVKDETTIKVRTVKMTKTPKDG
jgi:hypothetical protein